VRTGSVGGLGTPPVFDHAATADAVLHFGAGDAFDYMDDDLWTMDAVADHHNHMASSVGFVAHGAAQAAAAAAAASAAASAAAASAATMRTSLDDTTASLPDAATPSYARAALANPAPFLALPHTSPTLSALPPPLH